ncbi:UPAR/Ly6 domain-containing protein qvr-like isoform X2 [Liolophura sinensis]|uniref:UPAR/Ly6 domain-containing protein qvr-like isoform X2 n=1 Tax=Liolophura sinensis TaxID=3198878 RepID=UPI003158C805
MAVKAKEDIECYDCLTYNEDHYCSDPFNKTSKVLTTVMCEGYCAKWVREIKPGLTRVKRTCSSHLNIDMTIHLVCMEESRPGTGHICFCNKPRCNGTGPSRSTLQTVILSCLILTLLLPHFTRMVQ